MTYLIFGFIGGIIFMLDVALLCHWLLQGGYYNGRKEKRQQRAHFA